MPGPHNHRREMVRRAALLKMRGAEVLGVSKDAIEQGKQMIIEEKVNTFIAEALCVPMQGIGYEAGAKLRKMVYG